MKFSRRRRTTLAVAAISTASAIVLSACASSEPTPAPGGNGEISGEITFGTFWAYVDQSVIDGFEELYPEVTVNLEFTAPDGYPTKLQALAASGDLPDVFAGSPPQLAGIAKAGGLFDLTDALATAPLAGDFATWGESFDPVLLDYPNTQIASGAELEGEVRLAVPLNALSIATVYNQDIFDEVGIEAPETFDDMIDNCVALSEAGYIPMSLTGANWAPWWMQLAWDQTMRDDKAADFTPESEGFLRAYEIVEEMIQAGCWDPSQTSTDIAGETSLFLQGKTAQFTTVPENFLKSVVEGAEFELGSYAIPALAGVEPARTLGGGSNGIAIAENTDNAEAAIAFVKYLTSPDVQTRFAEEIYTLPSIQIDVSATNPLMEAYIEAASNGFAVRTQYLPLFTTAGQTTWTTEILPRFYLGQITPEEAAAQSAVLVQQ
jgi:raffinose/stachyose/melibiose transport system substrate-binding protein